MKTFKHEHGRPNPIIEQEEKAILLAVDRALSSTPNSQIIGRNGEVPFLEFLNRYLPPVLKAVTGHFITPGGKISPQLDVIIMDSRYPLLSQNLDGSVLVMLHSVVQVIEIKTNLTSGDVKKAWDNCCVIRDLVLRSKVFSDFGWDTVVTNVLAYRCAQRIDTIRNSFFNVDNLDDGNIDITILRYPKKDQIDECEIGGTLHFEPNHPDGVYTSGKKGGCHLILMNQYTPLSDFYYELIQNSYYSLGERNYSFDDLGRHIMDYMNWTNY